MRSNSLTRAFAAYLREGPSSESVTGELCATLAASGLDIESRALADFCRGLRMSAAAGNGTWAGKVVAINPDQPVEAGIGDLWLDLTDLTLMVLLSSHSAPSATRNRWVSVRPVQIWQYRGFLQAAKAGRKLTQFPSPADYLSDRFVDRPEMHHADNVYQDEALAYAHWFGKCLVDQLDWDDARHALSAQRFASLLPEGHRSWTESEYASSEFVRCAVGRESLDKDPKDEEELRLNDSNQSLADRMLFGEWERLPNLGFSSRIRARNGRILKAKSRTLFFEFENSASLLVERIHQRAFRG